MFKKIFTKKINWQEIKDSGKAFPETKISIVEVTSENGEMSTAWINIGYKDYAYKEFCETLGILTVDFEDMNELDYGEIQTYLETELNKACITHLISRIPTETGIEMLFYFEDQDLIQEKLEKIYSSENLLFDFGCSLQLDSGWETIERMMETYG
ncbi:MULTISPECIES: hypothetical protein [unclassified Lacinutrix]